MADEISSVLRDLDVNILTTDDIPIGADMGSAIVEAVLSADFVCVVLSDDRLAPSIMYEAGIATGSRRPLVVITGAEDVDRLPFHLFSAQIIRYQRNSIKTLRENLRAYLLNVQPIAAQLKMNWDTLLDEQPALTLPVTHFSGRASVRRIASRMASMGALVSTGELVEDQRVDIIATFPTLGSDFNPVLIEVKTRRVRQESDLQQILNYLRLAKARLGVVVYGQPHEPPEARTSDALGVLVVSEEDLMTWTDQRFIRELTKLRNQVVHSL